MPGQSGRACSASSMAQRAQLDASAARGTSSPCGSTSRALSLTLPVQFLLLSNRRPDGSFHISPDRIQRMWGVARELFDAPLELKQVGLLHVESSSRAWVAFAVRGHILSQLHSDAPTRTDQCTT